MNKYGIIKKCTIFTKIWIQGSCYIGSLSDAIHFYSADCLFERDGLDFVANKFQNNLTDKKFRYSGFFGFFADKINYYLAGN